MSYRPQVKADSNGTTQDLPIDAETVQGKTPVFTTTNQTISGNKIFSSIDVTTLKEGGSLLSSKYVNLANEQTISGTKSFTSGLKVSGRVANSGDDEGIVINTASNGYAGVCLGSNSGRRSVFYLDSQKAFWRYNNGSSSYDLVHPGKSGTIALTSDIPTENISTGTIRNNSLNIADGTYLWIVYPTSGSTTSFSFISDNSTYTAYHFAIIQSGHPGSVRYFTNPTTLAIVKTTSVGFSGSSGEVHYIKFKIE